MKSLVYEAHNFQVLFLAKRMREDLLIIELRQEFFFNEVNDASDVCCG